MFGRNRHRGKSAPVDARLRRTRYGGRVLAKFCTDNTSSVRPVGLWRRAPRGPESANCVDPVLVKIQSDG